MYGFLLGLVLVSALAGSLYFLRPRRVLSVEGNAMQVALHAASATLPHLRQGLTGSSARAAVPHLLTLTQAAAIGICDERTLLAFAGAGHEHHRSGNTIDALLAGHTAKQHDQILSMNCSVAGCPLGVAVVAALIVQETHVGSLVAFFRTREAVRPANLRVVQEAAALVSAQVELARLESQGERLARAELLALRAQISPHFVYNALAAVANSIHDRPDEARELLIDFAEFTRYAFQTREPYVSLREELSYVDRYLRLEKARFGERLRVRLEVAPEVLPTVVPVLSLQPLVENAVRHGLARAGVVEISITGVDLDNDVVLRVADDGAGMTEEHARAALEGRAGGIGLANVHTRLVGAFGPGYGLEISSAPGQGTQVRMTVSKFRSGVRAA